MKLISKLLASLPGLLFILTACNNSPGIIRIKDTPLKGAFLIQKTTIGIPQINFDSAVYTDQLGYPRIDFQSLRNVRQKTIIKKYDALILENSYIRLTLLPGRGKPYSLIYKVSGNEEFFVPDTAQLQRSPNKLGWWFMQGGVEYTMPDEEHGETWAAGWDWVILEDSHKRKSVQMSVRELRFGLRESVVISIFPDKAYFEASISITNPTDSTVRFQHWINPMWVPGGSKTGLTPYTEFIMPTREVYATERTFNNWMLGYSPDSSRLQSYDDNPMRFFRNWKFYGDLLAWKIEEGFYSAFSHEKNEGIVRIFPPDITPGCNIWTYGFEPSARTRRNFSGNENHNGYVEMWGGITQGFSNFYSLEAGKSISWKEWMYPYFNTKGLHYADKDLAITFLKKGKNSFEVNLCPSGEISRIKVVAVSPSTGKKYLQLEYRLSVPGNEIKSYAFTAAEDIELVISRRGKLIKRLKPKEAFSI